MKVYISADLEGISGVVAGDQLSHRGEDYDRARKLMTEEVNAAVEGALTGGAEEVLVNDGHGSMRNLLIEELHTEAQLVTGSGVSKTLSQMAGIDDSFDAVFFVGYHARVGTLGVLNHTISGSTVAELKINGQPAGETGLNAGVAGVYGVPLALVCGDSQVAQEARQLIPQVETVEVKKPAGRYAAKCLTPKKVRKKIESAAAEVLKRVEEIPPLQWEAPVKIEIAWANTAMADITTLIPSVDRKDSLTTACQAQDTVEAYKIARAMIYLAGATRR